MAEQTPTTGATPEQPVDATPTYDWAVGDAVVWDKQAATVHELQPMADEHGHTLTAYVVLVSGLGLVRTSGDALSRPSKGRGK